ncbi:HIT domain-containing protein [Litorivicinus sp.]|nr:HIT domain-containing protein [Litorivicinus sp.]
MSHVYQPVMLKSLLENRGRATKTRIAKALLEQDRSQLEYYETITSNMVGRVLTKNRGITEKNGDEYHLIGFEELSKEEISELASICESKIDDYLEKRGDAPWVHRKKSSGIISGSVRHKVLVQAKYRCLACGISAEQKALEVDHILPRNHGGSDELHNLQALCYSCNSAKRDQDDTDLRKVAESYTERLEGCLFCDGASGRVIGENELCFAIRDGFPVTEGHSLIIPKRHISDYFDLYKPEINAVHDLTHIIRKQLLDSDPTITGFNIGVNAGESAGQTIFHCHVHVIPRRDGDMENPKGGVRGVIPSMQTY